MLSLPLPVKFLDAIGVERLNEPQRLAIENGLLDGKSVVVSSPTASGKTVIAEIAMIKNFIEHGKTLYLVDPRFDDSGLFLRQVQNWFAEHMPSVKTKLVEMSSVYTKDDPKTWETIKANGDGAIIGVGH